MDKNIFIESKDKTHRYAFGRLGDNMLVAILLNPTLIGTIDIPDKTIQKIINYSVKNNYEGYMIFNVCPLKTNNEKEIPISELKISDNMFEKNFEIIYGVSESFKEFDLVVGWGDLVSKSETLQYIADKLLCKLLWGNPRNVFSFFDSKSAKGNPKHPSRGFGKNSVLHPIFKYYAKDSIKTFTNNGYSFIKHTKNKDEIINGLKNTLCEKILNLNNIRTENQICDINLLLSNLLSQFEIDENKLKIANSESKSQYVENGGCNIEYNTKELSSLLGLKIKKQF